jgi:AcrR family transcriptional regulator
MTEAATSGGARETRERVLEAAGELFAEKGFRDTTIREIKDRAGANIAAVNYYFRDKESLHREVLRRAFQFSCENVLEPTVSAAAPAADRLRFYIRASLESMLLPGIRPAWHTPLILREMSDPSPTFREITGEIRVRYLGRLDDLLGELMPPGTPVERRRLALLSVIGQFTYYRSARPIVLETVGLPDYTPELIGRVAEHIADFSLAAFRGMHCGSVSGRLSEPGSSTDSTDAIAASVVAGVPPRLPLDRA